MLTLPIKKRKKDSLEKEAAKYPKINGQVYWDKWQSILR